MNARVIAVCAVMLAAFSCGGDGFVEMMEAPPAPGPTLTSLQSSIFTPKCAIPACHLAPFPQQGMELSAGNTYRFTVGVDSGELPIFKRVAPGEAADSYLYMKIAGDPRIVGERMPLDGTITAAEIDAIRAWIDAGAKND